MCRDPEPSTELAFANKQALITAIVGIYFDEHARHASKRMLAYYLEQFDEDKLAAMYKGLRAENKRLLEDN